MRGREPARAGLVAGFAALSMLVTAAVAGAQIPGDADCDGVLQLPADVNAILAGLFAGSSCGGADANRDGRITAPDVEGVLLAIAVEPATPTATRTVRATSPTPTATVPESDDGPEVTFFGAVNADGCAACAVPNCQCFGTPTPTPEIDADGRQVFETGFGTGFLLVVEGKPGRSGFPVGTFRPAPIPGSALRPDLQILSDHDLGGGSREICDDNGVPGITPLSFENRADITDAMIDLECHFQPMPPSAPCTVNNFGVESVLSPGGLPAGSRQFCLQVSGVVAFPAGTETVMAVRLMDTGGSVGRPREIVVRVRQP